MGSSATSASPGSAVSPGTPAPALRMDRTSPARHRLNATARSSAARNACSPWAAQDVQLGQLRSQPGMPGRGRAGDEHLGGRAQRAELLLRRGPGPHRPRRRGGPRAAVVLIADRGPAGRDQDMLGNDLPGAGHDDQQPPVIGAHPDSLADQPDGHGVAGRGEPHARQAVHLAGDLPPGAGPQRRQRAGQFPLDDQPLGRHRADLAVHRAVDLRAPRHGGSVRGRQVPERRLRHYQVALGIAGQVLHDPLRFRIARPAEVRPEPVMAGEPDILRRGHHDVGHHAAFQAAHPVRQHRAGHPAQHLEALRQQRQRGLRPLITGEPHEPDPAPGQHRAEHVQPPLAAPAGHQMLTRRPHRRAAAPVVIGPPGLLRRRDQAPEVTRRVGIPRRTDGRASGCGCSTAWPAPLADSPEPTCPQRGGPCRMSQPGWPPPTGRDGSTSRTRRC